MGEGGIGADAPDHVTDLYFEAHITIEPVWGERLEELKTIVGRRRFRVADLLMKKRPEATAERSDCDTFCTARSTDFRIIRSRTLDCVRDLRLAGYDVWRYKIENTLEDVRFR